MKRIDKVTLPDGRVVSVDDLNRHNANARMQEDIRAYADDKSAIWDEISKHHAQRKEERIKNHEARRKANKFLANSGRKAGSLSQKTRYVNQLVKDNPRLSAKQLYRIADKSILGEGRPMKFPTFQVKVSRARNQKTNKN